MPRLTKQNGWLLVAVTLAGACLHFLYTLFPSPLTALMAPVNESLWEHLKILFWPGLAAALLGAKGASDALRAARLLCLIAACSAMLGVGYVYHVALGGASLGFDLCLYVLLMAAVVLLPEGLASRLPSAVLSLALPLTLALGGAILLFTFLPPGCILFYDLSGAPTWARLPC